MHDNPLLAGKIRTALIAAGLSQHKFAVFADMSPQTLHRYLDGMTWSAATEKKLKQALARLPRRKHPKHRRIKLEERPNGKA
jgi:transcriptional regulator with XRE-family HTH domain